MSDNNNDMSAQSDVSEKDNTNNECDVDAIASIRNNDPSFHCYRAKIYSEEDVEQLAKVLEGNTHLKRLSLDLCSILEFDAETLASAVANAKLTHFCLGSYNYRFNSENRRIIRCLLSAAERSPTIEHLDAFTVDDDSGLYEIASCMTGHLQSLHLSVIFPEDVELLYESLQRTTTLTSFHLSESSTLGKADNFRRLSQVLANNSSLTSLSLGCCTMDNDGVKTFLEHWHHDSQISTLAFTDNYIKAEGAMLLIQAASSHPAMESLDIKGNRCIGYEGLANIATELLPNVVLKSLNLASCCVLNYARNDPILREAAVVVGDLIARGVSANTHLVEMDVSDNGYDAVGQGVEEAVAFYTLRNKYSPLMLVSELHLPASIWCHCFAKNGQNASFIFHVLREQPMLWHACYRNKRQRTR